MQMNKNHNHNKNKYVMAFSHINSIRDKVTPQMDYYCSVAVIDLTQASWNVHMALGISTGLLVSRVPTLFSYV